MNLENPLLKKRVNKADTGKQKQGWVKLVHVCSWRAGLRFFVCVFTCTYAYGGEDEGENLGASFKVILWYFNGYFTSQVTLTSFIVDV